MTEMFPYQISEGVESSFLHGNVIRRPRFSAIKPQQPEPIIELPKKEERVIHAPRTLLIGRRLNKETGEDMGPFYLPIDDLWHEPSLVLEGGSGSGKSVAFARIVSELILEGRSVIICDYKGQYSLMGEPNSNPDHVAILEEYDEEPMGMGNIDVWLPNHIVNRLGHDYCRLKYRYDKPYTIRTEDMDAGGLLLLGNKATEGKDYVLLFDTLLATLKKDARNGVMKYDIETIIDLLNQTKEAIEGTKRSVNVIEIMLHNLVTAGVIADNGNNIFEFIEKPKKNGKPGKLSIFNTGAAGPSDVQSKGIMANLINGMMLSLMTEWERIDGKEVNAWRPGFFVDEASTYFSKDSSSMVMSAFNSLQYVNGRTLGIFRGYVYQTKAQQPKDLTDSDTLPIYIKLQQSLPLYNSEGVQVDELNDKGLAIVSIKNVGFMNNQSFYVRILPPKCEIRT
ncbi:MAG: DUF87 domain-containing protein [Candidatus Heimdallarchaeota archaeon]|nr:DUF87 domain-containing protein [Candidatus Heimdallarchaeota archaeon]